AGVVFFLTERVGIGRHRGIQMFSVEAECQPEKISLVSTVIQSGFGKLGERVRRNVEYGKRLIGMLAVFGVSPVAAVEENDEAPVGRNGSSRGEIVDRARMTGYFAEQTAIGELSWRLSDCCGRGKQIARERKRDERNDKPKLRGEPGYKPND